MHAVMHAVSPLQRIQSSCCFRPPLPVSGFIAESLTVCTYEYVYISIFGAQIPPSNNYSEHNIT